VLLVKAFDSDVVAKARTIKGKSRDRKKEIRKETGWEKTEDSRVITRKESKGCKLKQKTASASGAGTGGRVKK